MQLKNPAKASPEALMNAAKARVQTQDYDEAATYLTEALNRDIDNHEAYDLMCEIRIRQGNRREAILYCMNAIKTVPENVTYLQRFIDIAGNMPASKFDPDMDDIIVACLSAPAKLDCKKLQMLWLTHLIAEPSFKAAYNFRDGSPPDAFDAVKTFEPLLTERFLLGIKNLVVHSPVFEQFITRLRRYVLEDADRFAPAERLLLAEALAHYAFHTDYILDTAREEQPAVDALQAKVEADPSDACDVAVMACYVPLSRLKNADAIEKLHNDQPAIGDLVKAQIGAARRLAQIASEVTAITPVSEGVSEKVRAQYEEFPYPRWRFFSAERIRRDWPRAGMNMKVEGHMVDRRIDILNAGCGTGQEATALATIHPKSQVLAVDLSRASLAYGIDKAREFGITNVDFKQADITQLGTLDKKFDLIVSSGVLHHMANPVEGWRVLTGLLKPGGLMRIALYSKIARESIIKLQNIAKEKGYGGDFDSMRLFRKIAHKAVDPQLISNLYNFSDYYYMTMYRDLLFHVQEHDYDLHDISAMLDELGLEFVGFFLPGEVTRRYVMKFPDDPEAVNLAHWHEFEKQNPHMFVNMYQFWCRKKA